MKPLADYAHSKGLFYGLYTCAGTETCVGGRPGSKDHWTQDAALWAEWGCVHDMRSASACALVRAVPASVNATYCAPRCLQR